MPRWIWLACLVAIVLATVDRNAADVVAADACFAESESAGLSLIQKEARTFFGTLAVGVSGMRIAPTSDTLSKSGVPRIARARDTALLDVAESPITDTTESRGWVYVLLGGLVSVAVLVGVLIIVRHTQSDDDSTVSNTENRRLTLSKDGPQVQPPSGSSSSEPNAVHTTRFTLITWLPKSLYLQFHRVANIYFVAIAILACTPLWGGQWASKVCLVSGILLLQAFKDGWEDMRNSRDDKQVNSLPTRRYSLQTASFEDVQWQNVDVGDLILIEKKGNNSHIPADMIVLGTAERNGLFYLSTKMLDGETNLKERQTPTLMQEVLGRQEEPNDIAKKLLDTGVELNLEPPRVSLLEFNGSLQAGSNGSGAECSPEATCGVNLSNIALRGSELHNTKWVLGVACYVGDDTKARLNSAAAPSKTSDLAALLNNCVLFILAFIIGLSLFFAICSLIVPPKFPLLGPEDRTSPGFFEVFVKYSIVLYCCLPMTLYVAFEFLHLIMGYDIENDDLMYDKPTSAHAKARNTSVVEELGQVDFVFSDKTGTLTANEMRFAACCIGSEKLKSFLPGESGEPGPGSLRAKNMLQDGLASEFFEALALCHTVKVDEDGNAEAESPDEVALVEAAAAAGMAYRGRELSQSVPNGFVYTVDGPHGSPREGLNKHTVGHILAFSSDRKRMSVVCPTSSGAEVITKGADNVMKDLLVGKNLPSPAQDALDEFSRNGLRTLVLARRTMTISEYEGWKLQWENAGKAMERRDEALELAAASAEIDMTYIGITALEDRLQDKVPETIKNLRDAGVRVWVLTGDKVETAVEIAKSCKLFDPNMPLIEVVNDPSAVQAIVRARDGLDSWENNVSRGMVLDGASVALILADSTDGARKALYEVAEKCSSCVCCRLSPLQKRELVELVRQENQDAITLSIGDGANDVPMIQGAHVGIGIRGKEGSASVQASDMAISQFSFLACLLFGHGRKGYRRMATFLCFFIYRSVVLGWSYVIYAHCTSFSGQLAFPEWLDIFYSPVTTIAVVVLVAFDCDYKDEDAMQRPELYKPGPSRAYLNVRVFLKWMLLATIHGVLAWVVPVYLLTTEPDRQHQTHSFWQASFVAFTVVIIIVHLKLFVVAVKPMNAIGVGVILLEMFGYFPVVFVLGSSLGEKIVPELRHVPMEVITSWPHLLCLVFVPLVAISADLLGLHLEDRLTSTV